MLRRALNLIKKICEKRGSILYIPCSASRHHINLQLSSNDSGTAPLIIRLDSNKIRFQSASEGGPAIAQLASRVVLFGRSRKDRNKRAPRCRARRSAVTRSVQNNRSRPAIAELSRNKEERQLIPEALFILNVNDNSILIKEAIKLQLPVIGVIDSDTNPFGVHYPIPGSSEASADLYTALLLGAFAHAKKNELSRVGWVAHPEGHPAP